MSMACCSSPLLEHDDGWRRAPALDLLDECWFFSNTLVNKKKPPPLLPRSPPISIATATGGSGEKALAGPSRLGGRRLLRTPSLPASRVGMMEIIVSSKKDDDHQLVVEEEDDHRDGDGAAAASASASARGNGNQQPLALAADEEVEDDDLNWSSIYEGVLRTRLAERGGRSTLRRAPSMPVITSTTTDHHHHQSMPMPRSRSRSRRLLLRHSHSTLGRHSTKQRTPGGDQNESGQPRWSSSLSLTATQQQQEQPGMVVVAHARSKKQMQMMNNSFRQLEERKWKSSSDLESIEVERFRDLAFVFDEELRDSLADVLPGLKQQQQRTEKPNPRLLGRPYLSEEWRQKQQQQVRRPALARVQSAAEMKDQLRMWARAVACNVRHEQEC